MKYFLSIMSLKIFGVRVKIDEGDGLRPNA